MAERSSWYQTVRKRGAPLVFLVALVVLATETCSADIAEVEIALDFGPAASDIRSLRVDIFPEGSNIGVINLQRTYDQRGVVDTPRMRAQLDPGDYELAFDVTLADRGTTIETKLETAGDDAGNAAGERVIRKRFTRAIAVGDRAKITVPLQRDLRSHR